MDKSAGYPVKDVAATIATCQKIMRLATVVMLGAFALIIVMTTASTGSLVLWTGKALYYVIVLGALVSLGTWLYRTRLEKQVHRLDREERE